jgi:hypothetical protein
MLDPKRRQGRDHVDGRPAPSAVCVPPACRLRTAPRQAHTGAHRCHQCTPVHTNVCPQPMREPRPGSPAASTHHRQQETWRRPPLPCVSSCSRRVAPQRVDWHRLGVEQVLARSCRPGVNRASTWPVDRLRRQRRLWGCTSIPSWPHLPPSKADAGRREACHGLATSFAGQFHLFEARRYAWCVLSGRAQL